MITINEIWEFYLSTKEFKPNSIKKEIQRYNRHIYILIGAIRILIPYVPEI